MLVYVFLYFSLNSTAGIKLSAGNPFTMNAIWPGKIQRSDDNISEDFLLTRRKELPLGMNCWQSEPIVTHLDVASKLHKQHETWAK